VALADDPETRNHPPKHTLYRISEVGYGISGPISAVPKRGRPDKIRRVKTIQDKTRQDKTRQDKTRQDKTRQAKTRQDKTRHDKRRLPQQDPN
jgi:hypothetical protein